MAGRSRWRLAVWNEPTRTTPAHGAGRGRGEVGLRALGAGQQALCVLDEHERRVGQPHAAAGRLEQRGARLALEHLQLLRDGRRAVGQRLGDGADRPAAVQLVQEAQAGGRALFDIIAR